LSDTPLISVPADILDDCRLERWALLSSDQLEAVAVALTQTLAASDYAFTKWRIERHGPDGQLPVLIFTDARSHLDFALIPGGTLLPGYDEAQLQRYTEIYMAVEQRDEAGEGEEEDFGEALFSDEESEREALIIDRPIVFASRAQCDLRRKPPVPIAPFLMATTPILAETAEIAEVVTLPHWWRETWDEMAVIHQPVRLRWEMVAPVLERYRWDVPTTHEWEWASQGGKSGIFYWGNEVPRFVVNPIAYYADEDDADDIAEHARYAAEMDARIDSEWPAEKQALLTDAVRFEDVMRMRFSPSSPHCWPYANGFGLVGLLAWGEWCAPSNDPDDPYPLIIRGGAAGGFPWQSCHEWLLLLRAAEARQNIRTNYGDWNTLRPILRLRGSLSMKREILKQNSFHGNFHGTI